jgi:hypothetical protein
MIPQNKLFIDDWYLVGCTNLAFQPPKTLPVKICGVVFNHSRIEDGTVVLTSAVVEIKKEVIYTVSGSKYELGDPIFLYEKQFPNARQRFLNQGAFW